MGNPSAAHPPRTCRCCDATRPVPTRWRRPGSWSATELLGTGFGIWLYTIIAFTFLYWALDGGGPQDRAVALPEFPDLAFPEQMNPHLARPGWRPEFSDYLYLGFTNATAFSPTDVMPLSRWAKLARTVQAADSLMILGLVIATRDLYPQIVVSRRLVCAPKLRAASPRAC